MFVNGQPVEVTVGENTISVRPKMDLGTKNRCMDALAAIGRENGETEMAVHLGAYQVALMVENIISWRGPAFVGVSCTPANIAKLDPDEPLVELVLEEIVARNPLQKKGEHDAEKKDTTNAGEPSLPASA
jgi:hypothetical protein